MADLDAAAGCSLALATACAALSSTLLECLRLIGLLRMISGKWTATSGISTTVVGYLCRFGVYTGAKGGAYRGALWYGRAPKPSNRRHDGGNRQPACHVSREDEAETAGLPPHRDACGSESG
ncbi:hypothetical protein ZWY2020_012171 [Hordeum vulgare]|nr:hypothetical protein ZWY2020_012171 [Hordeum vulgare]